MNSGRTSGFQSLKHSVKRIFKRIFEGQQRVKYVPLAVLLTLMGVALVIGAWQISSSGSGSDLVNAPPEVEELIPTENALILRQAAVGIQLEGIEPYDIQLWINGVALPIDEVDQSATRLTYMPGDDKTFEEWDIGGNRITVRYSLKSRPEDITDFTWRFRVAA